jgi:hypothetical protein
MDRQYFEDEFSPLYSGVGALGVLMRLMDGCLILNYLENLGNETLVPAWRRRYPNQCPDGSLRPKLEENDGKTYRRS